MTTKWLLEAAEARFPMPHTPEFSSDVDARDRLNHAAQIAFIAGAELMAEKAADVIEAYQEAQRRPGGDLFGLNSADAIRSLTTDGGSNA